MYVWFLVSFGNCLIVVRRSKSILAKPLLQNKFLLDQKYIARNQFLNDILIAFNILCSIFSSDKCVCEREPDCVK